MNRSQEEPCLKTTTGTLLVVKRTVDMVGFAVLPVRWQVERTFAWLGNSCRLCSACEGRTEVSEAFIYVAMIYLMLMLHRLKPA